MRFWGLVFATAAGIWLSASPSNGDNEEALVNGIEKAIREPSPQLQETARLFDGLFRDATQDQLRQLTRSSSRSVALYARWLSRDLDSVAPYSSLRAVPGFIELPEGTEIPHGWLAWLTLTGYPDSQKNLAIRDDTRRRRRSESLRAQAIESLRELGCTGISRLETRFRIIPPPEDGYYSPLLHYVFNGPNGNYDQVKGGFSVPRGTKVRVKPTEKSTRLEIAQDDTSGRVLLDRDVFQDFAAHSLAVCIHGERVFLAAFTQPSHRLYCADRQTGALLWSRPIWGSVEPEPETNPSGFGLGWRGRCGHFEENIVCTGNEVLLFGYGSTHIYIECFAEDTGEPLYKFSSRLWRLDQD